MAWTYDSELPTDKDKVRILVGDTDANDKLLDDEEINFAVTRAGNLERAAAMCCRIISAKLRRELSLTPAAGSISQDSQAQADGFLELAEKLESQAVMSGGAGVFGGGISKDGKRGQELETDRVEPAFVVEMHSKRRSILDPRIELD